MRRGRHVMTEQSPAAAPGDRHSRRRWLWPAVVVAGAAVAGTFLAAGLTARATESPGRATPAVATYGRAPAYRLVDQNRHLVSSRELLGRVQVVSFLFPYCRSFCPLIARTMAELADTVAAGPLRRRVQLVSFNVDPAGASPAVLRRYIAQYGADPASPVWRYLTGTPSEVRRVVTGGFHIFYDKVSLRHKRQQAPAPHEANPLGSQAHVNYDVAHEDFVEIVNARGEIVAVFDQASTLTPARLLTAIKDTLAGRAIPPQQVG